MLTLHDWDTVFQSRMQHFVDMGTVKCNNSNGNDVLKDVSYIRMRAVRNPWARITRVSNVPVALLVEVMAG